MTMLDDRPIDEVDRPRPWSTAAMSPAAEIGRWRLSARLAGREIRRRPWRTVLVVLLIGVPVAGLVVADAAYRSSQLPADQSHRFGAADARVTATGERGAGQRLLAGLPGDLTTVSGAEAWFLPLRSTADPDTIVNVDLSTLDLTAPLAAGIARPTSGRLAVADDEVFLSAQLAGRFHATVGDTLRLVRPAQSFTVVGIGTASGYQQLFNAPGFDVGVLQPQTVQWLALVDGPAEQVAALGSGQPGNGVDEFMYVEFPPVAETDHLATFLGWVFSIMLMAVLGIVVSAAFAVSGRRQLVTIGQLSASGTDPSVLRRYLALQGTWSGALGVGVGLAAGCGLVPLLHGVVANDGRTAIGRLDLVVIALIALTSATLAAIVPTRDLTRTSVLAALGGRRPVATVRPHQVQVGALLVAGGLTALWLAITSARQANDSGDGLGAATVLAGAGGLAVLAGMCCVCPVVVDIVARVGSRRHGPIRLATRGLGRHRARSAAIIAAVAAFGAAAMAAGATAEQEFADRHQWYLNSSLDLLQVDSTTSPSDEAHVGDPVAVEESVFDQVQAVVGPVYWFQARQTVATDAMPDQMLVADPGLLDLIGLTAQQRAAVVQADAADIEPLRSAGAWPVQTTAPFASLDVIEVRADVERPWTVISPDVVERLDLRTVASSAFGVLDHDITRHQYDQLMALNVFSNESAYFVDVPAGDMTTQLSIGYPQSDYSMLARLAILGGTLLLTMVVVAVGMALWAAEGKDERDALVSIGASPSVLARVVGIKAWLLAFVGGVIAVPLGYGTLRLAVAAAGEHTRFPWFVAGGVVVVVPLLIGVMSTVGSAIAQRVRPVRMSTLAAD